MLTSLSDTSWVKSPELQSNSFSGEDNNSVGHVAGSLCSVPKQLPVRLKKKKKVRFYIYHSTFEFRMVRNLLVNVVNHKDFCHADLGLTSD